MTLANAMKLSRGRLRSACCKAMPTTHEDFAPDWSMGDAWMMVKECRRRELSQAMYVSLTDIGAKSGPSSLVMWFCTSMQPIDVARACLVALTEDKT